MSDTVPAPHHSCSSCRPQPGGKWKKSVIMVLPGGDERLGEREAANGERSHGGENIQNAVAWKPS